MGLQPWSGLFVALAASLASLVCFLEESIHARGTSGRCLGHGVMVSNEQGQADSNSSSGLLAM